MIDWERIAVLATYLHEDQESSNPIPDELRIFVEQRVSDIITHELEKIGE